MRASMLVLCAWFLLQAASARATPLDAAEAALRHGRYDEAATLALEAEKRGAEKHRGDARLLAAKAHARRGRVERAIEILSRVEAGPSALPSLALRGQLETRLGRHEAAERTFYRLIEAFNAGRVRSDDGPGMAAVAQAAHALSAFRDANQAFIEATRASPEDAEIELAWAELFLDKQDLENASKSLARALELAPENAQVIERSARLRLLQGGDFAEIEQLLAKALAIDPSLVSAHVSLAGLALRDMELETADAHLTRALAVDPRDLEALSVRAAVRFLADDKAGFERAVSLTLAENPRFSRVYSIIATYAEWEHRYAELVALSDRALALDPDDVYAHATRALNLLRVGREREGLVALAEAWKRDHYNVQVYNTLNLYDDVIAKHYETLEAPPFALRVHKEEKAVLARYALPLLTRAYAGMRKRYGMTPDGPLSVELYADKEHFSVRTSGLPHLGVQGVCFGKVLTALSPRGGEFNWGQILWHELSHVFHVQLSKSHVPRWFTEGLAEYETLIEQRGWKREDDRLLWDVVQQGALPRLEDLNAAFTHARNEAQLMAAYYGSSQAVEYLIARFGFEVVPRMLRAWGEGKRTAEVFQSVLGSDVETIDRAFRAELESRLSKKYARDLRIDLARFDDLDALSKAAAAAGAPLAKHAALALGLAVAERAEEAQKKAREVLAKDPHSALARFTLVHLALVRSDVKRGAEELRLMFKAGHDGYQLRLLLARCLDKQAKREEAMAELEAAIRIDPERPEAHELIVKWDALGDEARLTRALEDLVSLDQHARGPLAQLLPLLAKRGQHAELVARAEAGVYLDPHSVALHRLWAEGLVGTNRAREAVSVAAHAVTMATSNDERARALLTEARARLATGAKGLARARAQAAAKLDPSLAEEVKALLSR
jgi:tetratricopeptide (TPR) repeat protein